MVEKPITTKCVLVTNSSADMKNTDLNFCISHSVMLRTLGFASSNPKTVLRSENIQCVPLGYKQSRDSEILYSVYDKNDINLVLCHLFSKI